MTREEALKIVRENYPHFGTTEPWLDLEKALATLIPELAESEDERIRKELVEAFEALDIDSSWNGIPVNPSSLGSKSRRKISKTQILFPQIARQM